MIRFDMKVLRPRDTVTGKFVSFKHARRSSVFRKDYQAYQIRLMEKELRLKDKRIKELEKELKRLKKEKMKWKKVELPPPPEVKMMYDYIRDHTTKSKYEKIIDEINEFTDSNIKKQTLVEYYSDFVEEIEEEEE